jgi:ribosomal protein L13
MIIHRAISQLAGTPNVQVYKGQAHPHSAQQPEAITFKIKKKQRDAVSVPWS